MEQKLGKAKGGYDFIDLVKFILSMIIVAIHNSFLDDKIYPWARVAVPLFFMISAYFLFVKLKKCSSEKEKNQCVKKYTLKNIQLYLFWTIVQLPINIVQKFDFDEPLYMGVLGFIKRIIVGKGFTAAWFLLATVIATVLIYVCSKKLNNITLVIISALIYGVVSIESSYPLIMDKLTLLDKSFEFLTNQLASPVFSFPAALIWVALGKWFAEDGIKLGKITSAIGSVAFAVALYAEWRFVYSRYELYDSDCFFALMPLSVFLFGLVLNFKEIKIPAAVTLRKLSVIIYVTHGVSGVICRFIFKKFIPISSDEIIYVAIVLSCVLVGLVIIELQKHIKILKYAI